MGIVRQKICIQFHIPDIDFLPYDPHVLTESGRTAGHTTCYVEWTAERILEPKGLHTGFSGPPRIAVKGGPSYM